MAAKTIDELIDELIAREGGYVNNAADRGGPTIYGITQETARSTGYAGNMRDFPRSAAVAIYRLRYWDKPGFGEVAKRAPRVAAELFDTGVNMGVSVASRFLQRALTALNRGGKDYADLHPDGEIGGVTIAALVAYMNVRGALAEVVLLKALDCLQGNRYIELAEANLSQEAFLFGWLSNRIGQA
jgi:lysozyme family protein